MYFLFKFKYRYIIIITTIIMHGETLISLLICHSDFQNGASAELLKTHEWISRLSLKLVGLHANNLKIMRSCYGNKTMTME